MQSFFYYLLYSRVKKCCVIDKRSNKEKNLLNFIGVKSRHVYFISIIFFRS